MQIKTRLRAGERKSIARFRQHFGGARMMTAVVYRVASLFAPVAVLAILGIGISHMPHSHGLSNRFGLSSLPLMGMAADAAAVPDFEKHFVKLDTDLKTFMAKHAEEVKTMGAASAETKATLEKLGKDFNETSARLLGIEQKMTAPGGKGGDAEVKSLGTTLIESEGYKALKSGANRSGQVKVGSFHKNIVNATLNTAQPLVAPYRVPGVIMPGLRRLTVRDLMPSLPTQSNLIAFAKEASFTNSAASQTSESASKAQSDLTFSLSTSPVQTLAHFFAASRQILEDAPALEAYINARGLYGLKLFEENQLLTGDGTGTNLSGLVTNATAFDTTVSDTTNDTYIDCLRRGITQVQLSFFEPDAIILHPRDWEHIQLTKTTGTALNGQYIFSNPHVVEEDRIWGLRVVVTQAMTQSQFLIGAFSMAAAIWDKDDATIEVSREHASFFIQNMVAILCEERLALTVFRPLALVYGGFPFGS